jgi:hypothetical protein
VSCGAGISERLLCWLAPALILSDPNPPEITFVLTPARKASRRMGLLRTWMQEYVGSAEDATADGFRVFSTRKIAEDDDPHDDKQDWQSNYNTFMQREGNETLRLMSGGRRKTRRRRKQTKRLRRKRGKTRTDRKTRHKSI